MPQKWHVTAANVRKLIDGGRAQPPPHLSPASIWGQSFQHTHYNYLLLKTKVDVVCKTPPNVRYMNSGAGWLLDCVCWWRGRVHVMICLSIMTNAYIIGFMSPILIKERLNKNIGRTFFSHSILIPESPDPIHFFVIIIVTHLDLIIP